MASDNWFRVHVGATLPTTPDRSERDLYITPDKAVEELCRLERFSENVWECACGTGSMAKILSNNGYNVRMSDIEPMCDGAETLDFFSTEPNSWDGDIITNPPYKESLDFLRHALNVVTDGHKVVMFLPLTFLETKKRVEFFKEFPMSRVYIARMRLACQNYSSMNKKQANGIAFCWYVWEKGWHGEPTVRWFN